MPRKFAIICLIALLSAPLPAFALGLGEIELKSALNEPLDAHIELVSVQPGDLTDFTANVASLDTFGRYGLDRPDFLNSLRFELRNLGGRTVLAVRSTVPITEPFVTFLVEANWSSGRLLREYTVLLDPPVFNPQSAAPPVAAPQTAPSQVPSSGGFVPRPAPAPAPAPRRPVAAAIAGTSYGPVRRNETLWEIATRAKAGSDLTINQMMIAIFRANPDAFLGNINLLKEGATLTLPDVNDAARITRQDAFVQARDHNQRWRAGGTVAAAPAPARPAASTDDARRLRLVAPGDAAGAEDIAQLRDELAEQQARNDALSDQIETLRGELEESKRLFNLQSSDLAELQSSLADRQAADPAQAAAAPAADPAGARPPDTPAAVDASDTQFEPVAAPADPATAAQTDAGTAPADATPSDDAAAPVTTPQPTATDAAAPVPVTTSPPIQSAPSFLDRVTGFIGGFWPYLVGLLAALGAGLFFWRRRSDADAESWEALSRDSAVPTAAAAGAAATAGGDDAAVGSPPTEEIEYFEDTGTFKPIDFTEAEADVGLEAQASATGEVPTVDFPFEDTLGGDEALKLDQSDPLAEADFHMAYGLYDQAADLVRAASEREPQRRDLKTKLLEIYFVWGNKEAFLDAARSLHAEIGGGPDADWDKILIMGKQICPEDELFSGAAGAGADMVDLQLDDTGSAPVDLTTDAGDDSMDLDLGEAIGVAAGTAASVDNVIDFDFTATASDASDDDTLKERIEAATDDADDTEEMDLDELGIDIDLSETDVTDIADPVAHISDAAPTGESEVLDIGIGEDFDELFGGLDDAGGDTQAAASGEHTVDEPFESQDKLLDTSELKVEMEELLASAAGMDDDDMTQAMSADALPGEGAVEDTGSFSAEIESLAGDNFDIDIDFGGDDDDATELMQAASQDDPADQDFDAVFGSDDATVLSTALPDSDAGEALDDDFAQIFDDEGDSTAMMPAADTPAGSDDATVLAPNPFEADAAETSGDTMTFQGVFDEPAADDGGEGDFATDVFGTIESEAAIDLDVGEALSDGPGESGDGTTVKVAAQELALPELDETGSNEVGTKLDLARAYMEMGDPDGARGILQEVIEEGDAGQKQDARALLDALP